MILKNLSELGEELKLNFERNFNEDEVLLPKDFTDNVHQIETSTISFKTYSFIVKTPQNLRIFYPNQTIYMAAYFTEYYKELMKYKTILYDAGITDEQVQSCRDKKKLPSEKEAIARTIVNSLSFSSDIDKDDKELLIKFLSDKDWWHGGKGIERDDFTASPILYLTSSVNASQGYVSDLCKFLAENDDALNCIKPYISGQSNLTNHNLSNKNFPIPEQIIYYGAPGTGKSYKVENRPNETEDDRIRTTFHPDTDYSSFVGCYKPQQDKEDPKKIIYKFEGQCFAKAYVEAWKRLLEETPRNYTLVIEEINRGNCAQIFGDIFQLLDRKDDGFSQYDIQPDEDLAAYLRDEFTGTTFPVQYAKIADGSKMVLPPNLSIIATMNTSDQSLFPIDSAFKRRWDWEYIPIQYKPKDEHGNTIANKIDIDGTIYDWGRFIKAVNDRIYSLTHSEDKQLGYFFVRPAKGEGITKHRFVSKVVFYLWSDIYKDYVGRNDSIFKFSEDGDEKNKVDHSFNSFFEDGEIKVSLVKDFIEQFKEVKESAIVIEDSDEDDESGSKRNQYRINGDGPFAGKDLAFEAMKLYVNNNPNKTPQEIVNDWNTMAISNSLVNNQTFVATTQFYRAKPVPYNGGTVWVTTYGWTFNPSPTCPTPTIPMLIQEIKEKDWGINIEIIEP